MRNNWLRHGLENRYKRLLELEKRMCRDVLTLNEEQIRLLEKHNPEFRERHVESHWPGYLLCQDTFFVGVLKGVGRLWLQAVVDTYTSYAFCKLYTSRSAITSADILNDSVLPFFSGEGLEVKRILTDRATEYRGKPELHHYELFLALNDIEHSLTKVAKPRTNGFVERFHRTVLDEFFREAFRKKPYASLEELQADLDAWVNH